jgi:hypothetical protein
MKDIYDWIKILYLIDFKRNTAVTSQINRHNFHGRAIAAGLILIRET